MNTRNRRRRRLLEMSLYELAKLLGVSQTSMWEAEHEMREFDDEFHAKWDAVLKERERQARIRQ